MMISENNVSKIACAPQSFRTFVKKIVFHRVQNYNLFSLDTIIDFFNFNPIASKLITSYQKKICHYDKQQWEPSSLEDHILSRTENVCPQEQSGQKFSNTVLSRTNPITRTTSSTLTNDLIDLDLISGSAYTMKSKSQQGWISMLFHAILRVLFFPLYLKWWSEQTCAGLVGLLLILYIMQVISIRLYYQKSLVSFSSYSSYNTTNGTNNSASYASSNKSAANEFAEISTTEILMPIAMMIVLGIIHTQIVGTKNFKSSSSTNSTLFNQSKNRNNSAKHYSNDNVMCPSHHTDCSSSSGSSTSSSVDSSPVVDVRHRIQNRMARLEKFKKDDFNTSLSRDDSNRIVEPIKKANTINIPKIRFYNEYDNQNVLIIDNQRHDQIFDDDCNNNIKVIKQADSIPKLSLKRRKPRLHQINLKSLKSSISSWNYEDDNLINSSPISLRSSLYGSSFDSEGTISPMTPILLQGDEWPTVHSDVTSDVDDDDNHEYSINSSSKQRNRISNNVISEKIQSPNFYLQNNLNLGSEMKSTNPIQCKSEWEHHRSNKQQTDNLDTNQTASSNELKVSCSLWQHNICQKIDLSVVDISSAIIRKIETVEHSTEYIYLGFIFSITVALMPSIYRLQFSTKEGPSIAQILNPLNSSSSSNLSPSLSSDIAQLSDLHGLFSFFLEEAFFFNKNLKIRFIVLTAMIERFVLSLLYFFLLCVTERTFKQRFLYSKYFSHITRRDRAKRSQVPHFRLHKVRNLKVWLSVRSYLRRYGPHRSVDTICSTTFIISICLLTCISLQILKDSNESCTSRLICWEMIFWSLALGIYIMRLMILGSRINQKYRSNLSVLITEQINLYLQLERKPHKKDALMLANQVLKLAVDLLKELESPYKISGFSANPYLYNITKVVVLSAFSAVLTEMLGFKLKLYKIKLIR